MRKLIFAVIFLGVLMGCSVMRPIIAPVGNLENSVWRMVSFNPEMPNGKEFQLVKRDGQWYFDYIVQSTKMSIEVTIHKRTLHFKWGGKNCMGGICKWHIKGLREVNVLDIAFNISLQALIAKFPQSFFYMVRLKKDRLTDDRLLTKAERQAIQERKIKK